MAKKFTYRRPAWRLHRVGAIALTLLMVALAFSRPREEGTRGRVVDDQGPLGGACVRRQATAVSTTSDAGGRFELPGTGGVITAAKAGYFIAAGERRAGEVLLRLRPLPAGDNANYEWVDPRPDSKQAQNCANCHAEIYREWAGSAHGRSATNSRFLGLYAGADVATAKRFDWNLLKDRSNAAGVCAACHAPTVDFASEGFTDFRKITGVASRGIHCDFCHKIRDVSLSGLGVEHGRFAYILHLPPQNEQVFFGPLDDAARGEESFARLYRESRYCASCHEGTVLGAKVYTTYSEWLASPARKHGKQCQDCHMQPTGIMTNFAPGHGGVERDPKTLACHHLPGGNLKMLQTAVSVKTTIKETQKGIVVTCTTLATNVGHRVPTGFIDRHLILVVEGYDAAGRRLAAMSGPTLPTAAGEGRSAEDAFSGVPGQFFGRLIADEAGNSPVPFWRFAKELSDTRLIPDEPNVSSWHFAKGAARFQVRLIYRPFFRQVANAKGWGNLDITIQDTILQLAK